MQVNKDKPHKIVLHVGRGVYTTKGERKKIEKKISI